MRPEHPQRRISSATPSQAAKTVKTQTPAHQGPITEWSRVAEWYDAHVGPDGSEYHQRVILPGVLRMLRLSGKSAPKRAAALRVLDMACGQGVLCRRLSDAGCAVLGVDSAQPLIAAAREHDSKSERTIQYTTGDVTQLPLGSVPFVEQSFDAVTLVLAVQNLSPLSAVWNAAQRLLVPGGALVIVMMHPCFRIPRQSDWSWDETRGVQSRVIDSYLSSSQIDIDAHPGQSAQGRVTPSTTHFHRPLQAYVNTLGSAGLLIDRVEEWCSHKTSQPGKKQRELDRSRKEIPLFMALRAIKVAKQEIGEHASELDVQSDT